MIISLSLITTMVYENYRRALRRAVTPFDKHANWRKQAQTLKLSREAQTRLKWFIYHETKAAGNVSLTCRHFGIARKTFCVWKERFGDGRVAALENKSSTPHTTRTRAITPTEEERIVTLRKKHIRWGKMKLAKRYQRTYGTTISSWKVQYTIQKYNLYYHPVKNEKLQKKRKRNQTKKRITELNKKPFPGYLIALDTIVIYYNGTKRYILTAIDTVSKIAFARMYTTKTSRTAADFINRVAYVLDYELWNTLTDNGSEFHKEFLIALKELKLEQYWSRARTPTDNPVNERFNRTLQEEFVQLGNYTTDLSVFNQRLTEWLVEYCFVRPHQALGYDTPWEYYARANKLLPRYSSRTVN